MSTLSIHNQNGILVADSRLIALELGIQPDEQQQLLTHARAVTNPLPDELNPVASAVEVQRLKSKVPVFLPEVSPIKPVSFKRDATYVCDGAIAIKEVFSEETQLSTQPEKNENNSLPIRPIALGAHNKASCDSNQSAFPTDDEGNALNPGAYMEWNPSPIEGEPISPTELEELNQWLNDPILKPEVLSRVMRSETPKEPLRERYTVDFDEEGKPIRVVEIINTPPPVERDLSKNTD